MPSTPTPTMHTLVPATNQLDPITPIQEQHAKLAEEGFTDFNVERVLEEEDCDEMYGLILSNELSTEFVPFVEIEQDEVTSRGYSLKKPSKALRRDLDDYRTRRTATINRFRRGRAVEQTTCDGDVSNGLRVLGWFKSHRDASQDDGPIPLTLRAVFSHARLAEWVEQYLEFLEGRGLQWSSKANYTTGIINILSYAIADDGYVLTEERGQTVMEQVLNLRRQCDANATIQKMYRRRHKVYTSSDRNHSHNAVLWMTPLYLFFATPHFTSPHLTSPHLASHYTHRSGWIGTTCSGLA